jgi:hypothetical protein
MSTENSDERRSPAEMDQRSDDFTIPDEVVHDLKKPFRRVASDEMIERVTFRPPTAGETRKIAKKQERDGEVDAGLYMLELLNNEKLLMPDIERMNFIDAQICGEKLAPFLALRPRSVASND